MLTSVRGPMLGTHTPERWGRSWMRYDRSTGTRARFEIRAARTTERELWESDFADENAVEWHEFLIDPADIIEPITTGVFHADIDDPEGGFYA